ncbi:F-box protein SKIP28-like [Telopea speciosissima]|uniref:F-box protein SKIP28-like n=1 Tax=Telopea speciosissima TaxID=54955 RepID=UPI001CC3C7DB|nr:F-box protein SKIP28-like [Telopea speciosissima]
MESPQFDEKENHEIETLYDSQSENGSDTKFVVVVFLLISMGIFTAEELIEDLCFLPAHIEEAVEPGEPHEVLFLVLAYLQLRERLLMMGVCKSLRDAVNNDLLLWLDIVVEPPLSYRLSNDALLKITSKAHGRLRTLFLSSCGEITDDGLQRVIVRNPRINKLYVPACTSLTANGIVTIVKILTQKNQDLKDLRLHGMFGIMKQHIETILSCLKVQNEDLKQPISFLYHRRFSLLSHLDATHPIDVNVCPKCSCVNLVYDCPRESCKWKREYPLLECRGCYHCVPRCDECGGCIELDELGDTVCRDILCSDCWLRLPKCNLCNRPYCNLHANRQMFLSDNTGFICASCHMSPPRSRDWLLLELEEYMMRDY